MQQLDISAALGGMARIPQFFVWRLTWNAADGKFDKVPCYPNGSQYLMSAKDPANWMTLEAATHALNNLRAAGGNYTLGFYLTAATGYWFLDIDKAIDQSGNWSDVAKWLYSALPGAAFEYSSSGRGMHLFGRGELPAVRQIKPVGSGLELYNDGRGVAFGFNGVFWGNADTDHTWSMNNNVCPAFFAPTEDMLHEYDYDGKPRDDWRGPVDDDDLLRRARASSSTQALFNLNKATFSDLYDGNMEVLHRAYVESDGSFAASEADYALAAHLAFWTGCDVDRIERLMLASALKREKWFEHKTYLRKLTIGRVCRAQKTVLIDKPVEVQLIAPTGQVAEGQSITGSTYLIADGQREVFKGCVYIADGGKVFVPMNGGGFQMMGSEVFNAWFGNYTFVMDKENTKIAKSAFECFTRSQLVKFPKVQYEIFRPDLEPGSTFTMDGVSYVNTYMPLPVPSMEGDITPFLQHVAKLLPVESDRAILLAYLAAVVQHKGVKFAWCPILQGVQGNGKSIIATCVAKALGWHFVHSPTVEDLSDKFNDWLYEKLFIIVNDMHMPRGSDEVSEIIKPMITEKMLKVEGKGTKKRMRNVVANFLMSMNRRDGVRQDPNERRYAIFFTAQQFKEDRLRDGLTDTYFRKFIDWLEKQNGHAFITHWLQTYPIPAELNPAIGLLTAPLTSTSDQVFVESRSALESALREAIEEQRQGFRAGWVCWQRLVELTERVNRYPVPKQRLEELLTKLGYVAHPALGNKGLTNNRVFTEDNRQVRLYVTVNHATISAQLPHPDVVNRYVNDQLSVNAINPLINVNSI